MGTDTKLYISQKYELDDIKTVIEKYLKVKVNVKSCHTTAIGMFSFHFKYKTNRMMYVHQSCERAGYFLLSLGCNEEAIEIMTKIAEVMGGMVDEDDCDSKSDVEYDGMLSGCNGLSYFLKYAALNNELENENDLVGLNTSIHKWHEGMTNGSKNKMNLFKEGDEE